MIHRFSKLISLWLLLFFLVNIIYANDQFGLEYDISGNKIEDREVFLKKLKQYQEESMIEVYQKSILTDDNVASSNKEIWSIYTEIQNMQKKFDDINSMRNGIDNKILRTKKTIQWVIDKLKETTISAQKSLEQITYYTNQINQTKTSLEKVNQDRITAKDFAGKLLNILYQFKNEYYNQDLVIDEIKLLAKSENIATTMSAEEIMQILTMKFDQLLKFIDQKDIQLHKLLNDLESNQQKYTDELKKYNQEIQNLNEQKQNLLEYIKIYWEWKTTLDTIESDLTKTRIQLISEVEEVLKNSRKYLDDNKELKKKLISKETNEDGTRYLSWPVYPIQDVQWAYNNLQYVQRYDKNNLGMDIILPQWTPIYAPADWYVYELIDKDGISLNYIILVHNYWYSTLITTINKFFVKKWEYVQRWQLIWLMWWEDGTKWAWFNSPGPRIHYEVFKDWIPTNPFGVTDLSSVKNPSIIPVQYDLKVLTDKLNRSIDLSSVEYIKWWTVEERTLNYLKENWYPPFDSLELWKKASAWHKLPTELGVCIAVAETSLGRNFASSRNVWNVWNNDRWDRIDLWSPLQGASLIFSALENKYLWDYYTLDKLSWYGNQDGAIYASSPINRQTNVTKCLSAIHGYWIPDDRPVRLPYEN